MAEAGLDAVHLEGVGNVAWLCGGRGNRVVVGSTTGACGVVVGANGAWLVCANNEAARLRAEVFADLPLPVVTTQWYDLPLWRAARRLLPSHPHWAADVPVPGASDAEALLGPLRQRLGEADSARYRALGADAAEALETALLETGPAWTELEVAGAIAAALKAREVEAAVLLVGGNERASRYRHLVPTGVAVGGGVLASITAVRHGLHASCTRAVSFGSPPDEVLAAHAAAVAVDRTYLNASRPGARLGDILGAGEKAYAAAGYYDDWKEHHQGGTTGYAGREVFAVPGSDYTIDARMAAAWNPTLPGGKSEDTVLIRDDGVELLTTWPGSPWPEDSAEDFGRAGILVL